ncbi:MAG: hypothetical protein ABJN14_02250 [Paracoccaceae bacterium]
MQNTILRTTASITALMMAVTSATAQDLGAVDLATLGEVSFATSCSADGQAAFEVGLLLLHHMMYQQSNTAFRAAAAADPDCAMAQWGIAMAQFHPLWPGGPTPPETEAGRAASNRLADMTAGSDREAAYIAAVQAFYAGEDTDYRARLAAWATAQRQIDEAYPDDHDAAAFDALAQLTLAPRGPAGLTDLREAGARMDALRQIAPLHPAGFHYAIHAYDHPALAQNALEIARGYKTIAPDVPHALHMPSHIFTRLGLWEESADWNARSAAAVLSQTKGPIINGHYPHAIDYAVYAHLQSGNVAAAEALLEELGLHPNLQDNFGSAYATAAAAARVPLETDDWAGAAALPTDLNEAISWGRYPHTLSMRWFARGIGAARSGDQEGADIALQEMAELGAMIRPPYWMTLHEAQTKSIEAWLALSHGDNATAITLMRQAADLEDGVGKAPVTPGHVLPARELLGDLLLATGDKAGAKTAYETMLAISPNRRRSLAGLAAVTH